MDGKATMKTITVLGNNSGRNAGDNAILGNLLDDFAAVRQDFQFKVPTLNTRFIRQHFGHHPVQPMGMMPWNLALKNFGLPLYRAMTQTDMVLIVDNILFDRKFHNPFVNNLNMISRIAPLCQKRRIPLVLYNCSIGPVERPHGIEALRRVMQASPLVITRDQDTGELVKRLIPNSPRLVQHADCALNTSPPSAEQLNHLIRHEGLFTNPKGTIGMNINAYIDDFNEKGEIDRASFCLMMAKAADQLIEKLGVDILFVFSQIMDKKITGECLALTSYPQQVKMVGNDRYTYQELTGFLAQVAVHAGLRTHTLIFCAAVNTPMVNINAYPKSSGFMKSIGMQDWTLDILGLTTDKLVDTIIKAFAQRSTLKAQMLPVVEQEKSKARRSVELVLDVLGS